MTPPDAETDGPAPDAERGRGIGDPCGTNAECGALALCAGGTCAGRGPACDDDTDCDDDSYCCTGACLTEGGTEAACIPYGQGPRGDVNDACIGTVEIGVFAPSVQCEWTDPPVGDPFPNHTNILTTPLVGDLPHNSGASGEIVVVTYNFTDGGNPASVGDNALYYGVIRVLSGQSCDTLENIHDPAHPVIAASTPALGDLDGDGLPEIVAHRAQGGVIAFKWNTTDQRYETFWVSSDPMMVLTRGTHRGAHSKWDGPSLHDLDDDGFPEVISEAEVFDGRTGQRLNRAQNLTSEHTVATSMIAVLGDVDVDGAVELVGEDIWRWDADESEWVFAYEGAPDDTWNFAFADFGTPGATANDFNPTALDGIAEVVGSGGNRVYLATLSGQVLMQVNLPGEGGGPPTIGDFDSDGFPEIASAGRTVYRVFDLDCELGTEPGCAAPFVRWAQPSQDASSQRTGSSIFDFDSDGQAEAVYADECYARVYDGASGEVLYSAFRSSCTWYENVVIADPDRDSNTEIIINSNTNCPDRTCPAVDPIHRGEVCASNDDCFSGNCVMGFCRCASGAECPSESACLAPPMGTPGTGDTCRAVQGDTKSNGLRVLRDRLDRWSSSRAVWNQHAYSVTNVGDDLSIPSTGAWTQNFTQADLNNYRQNVQGPASAVDQPDITGRAESDACTSAGGKLFLSGTVCNRGKRTVGAAMPATFYDGAPEDAEILCVSYTSGPVPVGGCLEVSCEVDSDVSGTITMVVNDDGMGGRTTVECNDENNESVTVVQSCVL